MNAICLIVDRLHAGYLGAYGNSWIKTPAVDRLACEAAVFDQALIDSPLLENYCRSAWHGLHALYPHPQAESRQAVAPPQDRPTLAAMLREAGATSALLTDERLVARHPLAVDFDDLIEVDPPWQAQGAAEIEQTHLAKCFVQVLDWLGSVRDPFLLWCHLGGLGTTWDAPLEFRRHYWEPGDPEPPASADVPDRMLPEDHDPDELLGIVQSYAGQVSLLDTCIGVLLDFLQGSPLGKETLLVVTSARGFPLGEHRRVGACDEALYGELVQAPLLIRFPDLLGAASRNLALVEPADLWATLLDWWGISERPGSPTAESLLPMVREDRPAMRDRLCLRGSAIERAIRTPAWFLRAASRPELFAKPDDRWEVNDVAIRCQEVIECLLDAAAQYEQTIPTGRVADLPPLSEVLLSGLG